MPDFPPLQVDFNKPIMAGNENAYMSEAIAAGKLSGDGPFTRKANALLEQQLGVPKALLTTSCTHALEMFAILLGIQPGDEVIIPSFTFVSTVNAFVLRGAKPVFADIRPDTLNLDEKQLEAKITSRTKAIVPVHYAGVGCEMDAILEIARRHNTAVVEDNAHGLFGRYKGRYLGTFGAMAAQSFHETKNFSCGEGGALLINDATLIERAEIIREKGTNRARFFRGEVDRYTWVDIGSSYLPSELIAAFLYAQLEQADEITTQRHAIHQRYALGLQPLATAGHLRLQAAADNSHNAHMFYIISNSEPVRAQLLAYLKHNNIHAVFHYVPLHTSPMGLRYGYKPGDLPVTEDLSARLIRLPCYYELSQQDQDRVIAAVHDFFGPSKA